MGLTGETGPRGEPGRAATISVEPAERVPFADEPYVYNDGTEYDAILKFGIPGGEPGPPGEKGAQGERGPIAATIPFSISSNYSSGVEISSDLQGNPSMVSFAGFGAAAPHSVQLQPGEWESETITITEQIAYPSTFIMPFDGVLQNIHILFANRNPLYLESGVVMYPFACLAVSDGASLVFRILQETITYTEPYTGDGASEIPKYSLRKGQSTGLGVEISEGTLVGIVIGWRGEGVTLEEYAQFSVSGGLFLE